MVYPNYYYYYGGIWGMSAFVTTVLLTIIILWSLSWKGVALWKSARKGQIAWFVILLIINTVGILEILYIFIFSEWDYKNSKAKKVHKQKKRKK